MQTGNRILTILASIALVALMSPLAARPAKVKTPQVKADTKAEFDAVSAEVRKQMIAGGRFEFVTGEEHAQVDASLDAMGALFDKYDTVTKMDQGSKVALFNDQETVNAILRRRDDQRLVCTSEMPTGSHIATTKCRTYGDIARAHSDVQNYMGRFQQRAQPVGGAGQLKGPQTVGH